MDMIGLLGQTAKTLGDALLSILPFVLLYEGARQWALTRVWQNASSWLAGGMTLLAIIVGMNAVVAHFTQKTLLITAPQAIPMVDDNWGRDFAPEKREEISRISWNACIKRIT